MANWEAVASIISQTPSGRKTPLHSSPFAILGASTRDDRRRIVELADQQSLTSDHDLCQKARSDLTNPRTRISAEIAWLPGVSPRKASQLLEMLASNPSAIWNETNLPSLARLNLFAAAFEAMSEGMSAHELALATQEFAHLAEDLDAEEVMRDLNEDRTVSGFPEVRTIDQIEAELFERKRLFRNVIHASLTKLPPSTFVDVITDIVNAATDGGDVLAPELLDALVDSYEVNTHDFLEREAATAYDLVKAAREAAPQGEAAATPHIDALVQVTRKWDKAAQPIQLIAKARGTEHEASRDLALSIRSLAIDLFNKHKMLKQAQKLTNLLSELFSELPIVLERVEQDANALSEIARDRQQLVDRFKEYQLSDTSFVWKDRRHDISAIKHLVFYRAVTTHKTNFVTTGKTEEATLRIIFASGEKADISIDEQGFFFNKNRSQQIKTLTEFYGYLASSTFERRLKFYEEQIQQNGYFVYDECSFYPRKKIVFRGRDFELEASNFFKSYGAIEMRKKDFKLVDKLKRELSFAKIPQFSTLTDSDVIFHLLKKHMGLTWAS